MFFKQPTSWQPRISRDLMISVASEISGQHVPNEGASQLPVQVTENFISHMSLSLWVFLVSCSYAIKNYYLSE